MKNNMKGAISLLLVASAVLFLASCGSEEKSSTVSTGTNTSSIANVQEEQKVATNERYSEFSESKIANSKGNIVLFFHAEWCGPCVTTDKSLELADIPENLEIFKVDFDSNLELRKKYGVTSKHTLVQIDNEGNLVKKWVGSKDLDGIISELDIVEPSEPEFTETQIDEEDKTESATNTLSGSYTEFSESKLSGVSGDIVLFFHALWCPSCVSLDKNLSGSNIPNNLNIFKLDYDYNTELKKKYGVTSQHTFVQVDNEGNLLKKWVGSKDLDGIKKNLK